MYDRPDPADQDEAQKPLQNAEEKSSAIEVLACAGGDHCANSRGERDAVEDEAHDGQGVIETDNGLLASAYCVFCSVFHHTD